MDLEVEIHEGTMVTGVFEVRGMVEVNTRPKGSLSGAKR
jgi:hypothetical protein